MQKKFLYNLALVLLLNLLIKPFWIFGIDRSIQNAVKPEDFGLYYALFNFSFLFNILLDIGITSFNNKNIAQNNHLLNKHLSSIIILRLLLGLLYTAVTLIVGKLIGYTFSQLSILLVMAFNQFLIFFIMYLRSNLAGLHLFKTDSIVSVLDRLIMIGICAVLLWGGITSPENPFQINWYVYAQTAAYLLTIGITLILVIDKAKLKRLTFNKAFSLMILKKSYPYAILVLLMTFYNRIDTVMLERLLPDGAQQSAIYASGYRLLDAVNMVAFLFAGLLLPMFARMLKLEHGVDELVKLAFTILMLVAIPVSVGTALYSKEITQLLYTLHIEESAMALSVLIFCFVAVSTTYVFGTLLTANGNLKELNTMAAAGMLLNILLNLILIPRYQAVGAAVSSLATQLITALLQVWIAQRVFRFKINYPYLRRFLIFGVVVFILAYLTTVIKYDDWKIMYFSFLSFCVLFAFILRFINIKEIFIAVRNS